MAAKPGRDEVRAMSRWRNVLVFLSLSSSLAQASLSDERLKRLPENHRKWLEEEVNYLITKVERESFLNLEAEEERALFVEAFWRKRDTNPTTPENEFRDEHYRRLEYGKEFFGRDTFRPGWMTDRGKFYIILGKPTEMQNYEGQDAIYPAELWFYNEPGLKNYGLPPFFYLLFFRRHGSGELQLYSPVSDGPQNLLTGYQRISSDFRRDIEQAYEKLYQISPELAQASLSFRTDEGDIVQFSQPSFGTISLLDQIASVPFRRIDTSYAENFNLERGRIESEYLFSYVPSWGEASVLPGPGGVPYLHWVIEIDPHHLALVKDEDKGIYGTVFNVSAEVTTRGAAKRQLISLRKESFVNLTEARVEGALRLPFAYSGMFPVAPGPYDLRIVLRNRACSGTEESTCRKSYTFLESPIEVPEWDSARPRLTEIVLAYGTERVEKAAYRAYRFGTLQLLPNPRRVYASGDTFVALADVVHGRADHRLRFRVTSKNAPERLLLEKTAALSELRVEPALLEFSLEGFVGDHYQLAVDLLDGTGKSLDTRSADFDVTPRTAVGRPGIRGSWTEVSPEVPGLVEMTLAGQYLNLENREKARELFEAAIAANPRLGPAREGLASLMMEAGNTDRVIELLEPVLQEVKDRYEVLVLLGEAHLQKKNYARAAELLESAMSLRRPDPRLLNFLALSHHQLGSRSRARELLERSLSLQPDQPEVKALLERLKVESANPGKPKGS